MEQSKSSQNGPEAAECFCRRNSKKIKRVLCAAIALVFCFFLVVKFVYGPSRMRSELTEGLSEYWRGSVRIYDCNYSFSAPQCLWSHIALKDADDDYWIVVKSMQLSNGDEISRLNISAIGCEIPLDKIINESTNPIILGKGVDLSREDFVDLDIEIEKSQLSLTWPDGIGEGKENRKTIEINFDQTFGISLRWPEFSNGPVFTLIDNKLKTVAAGYVDPQKKSLHIPHAEMDSLDLILDSGGKDSEDSTLSLRDIKLSNLNVWSDSTQIQNLNISLGQNGKVNFSGSIEGKSRNFECQLTATNLDLAEISEFTGESDISGICEYAIVNLSHISQNETPAKGNIDVAFDDVKIGEIGIFSRIMGLLSLTGSSEANLYDIKCKADLEYPLLKINSCKLTSSVNDIAVQSGTINLADRTMDLYVTLDMLEGGGGILGAVKTVVGKVIRLHITGSFDKPKSEFVKQAENGEVEKAPQPKESADTKTAE